MRNVHVRGQRCHSQATNLLKVRNECANQNAMRLMDICGKNSDQKKWRNLMVGCHCAICIYSMVAKQYKSTNVPLCSFNKPNWFARSINDFRFVISKYHVFHWTLDVAWEITNVCRMHCTNWYLSRPFIFTKLIFNQSVHFTLHLLNPKGVAYLWRPDCQVSPSRRCQNCTKLTMRRHREKSSWSKTISLRRVLATTVFT